MFGRRRYPQPAALVAEPLGKLYTLKRRRLQEVDPWPARWNVPDACEPASQRRARRLALLLMAVSSVVSILLLYGLWLLLRSVI